MLVQLPPRLGSQVTPVTKLVNSKVRSGLAEVHRSNSLSRDQFHFFPSPFSAKVP